jgi:HSP20 family molecular chaperone IbpA
MFPLKKSTENNTTTWFYSTPGVNASSAEISLVNNHFVLSLTAKEFDLKEVFKWSVPPGYDPDSFSFAFKDGVLKISGKSFSKEKKFIAIDLT